MKILFYIRDILCAKNRNSLEIGDKVISGATCIIASCSIKRRWTLLVLHRHRDIVLGDTGLIQQVLAKWCIAHINHLLACQIQSLWQTMTQDSQSSPAVTLSLSLSLSLSLTNTYTHTHREESETVFHLLLKFGRKCTHFHVIFLYGLIWIRQRTSHRYTPSHHSIKPGRHDVVTLCKLVVCGRKAKFRALVLVFTLYPVSSDDQMSTENKAVGFLLSSFWMDVTRSIQTQTFQNSAIKTTSNKVYITNNKTNIQTNICY